MSNINFISKFTDVLSEKAKNNKVLRYQKLKYLILTISISLSIKAFYHFVWSLICTWYQLVTDFWCHIRTLHRFMLDFLKLICINSWQYFDTYINLYSIRSLVAVLQFQRFFYYISYYIFDFAVWEHFVSVLFQRLCYIALLLLG